MSGNETRNNIRGSSVVRVPIQARDSFFTQPVPSQVLQGLQEEQGLWRLVYPPQQGVPKAAWLRVQRLKELEPAADILNG